jgi:hypothetical protein
VYAAKGLKRQVPAQGDKDAEEAPAAAPAEK